ncbi:hypothetical protein RH858_04020 [Halalkaliarchaeum sp. AArc-GB]|uniref:hypothetical protein n=1 Tax=Halalkaliarchaeum sp. AArc-GB TaxID=3074078 RepID=UPI002854E96E|nr:hypothetical protein [Halalkaliarchaeum sp. AArc-GB]MDR5672318.1 hypothetical protein [Halalkaliarchaeum sp. AArc-GB]
MSNSAKKKAVMSDILRILINNHTPGGRRRIETGVSIDKLCDYHFQADGTDDEFVETAIDELVTGDFGVDSWGRSGEMIYLEDCDTAIDKQQELEDEAW